jgi:hypothetical protein
MNVGQIQEHINKIKEELPVTVEINYQTLVKDNIDQQNRFWLLRTQLFYQLMIVAIKIMENQVLFKEMYSEMMTV